jgi:alkylation response protein AidB-like acyl-CoA dehydrogenase
MPTTKITSPDSPALGELCARLAELGGELDRSGQWPAEQLALCGQYGVYEWFLDPMWGGQGWDEEQTIRGYMALASACLTTTFILTQRTGGCRRIAGCHNQAMKERLLPGLASGELFTTVGISHLTTSRRHLGRPVLTAEATPGGFRLDGLAPWVTGGAAADVIVIAATLTENGTPTDREMLLAVPTDLAGLTVAEPLPLVGVSASSTGPVHLDGVEVSQVSVIVGPAVNVMRTGLGGSTGGYETSALAIGLAKAAVDFLAKESERRPDLQSALDALRREHDRLRDDLLAVLRGEAVREGEAPAEPRESNARGSAGASPSRSACERPPTKESVRQRANTFVLRATQAALSAAKGTGFVVGHPAGRWCREALFFLVWSCPQPVAAANLCELAGVVD